MKLFHSRLEFSLLLPHRMALAIALLLVLSLQPVFGQTVTSSLSGTVADTSGAGVPNAKVLLTNQGTNSSQSAMTSAAGYFSFTAILPGTYTLTISAKGFSTWEEKGITINQQESRTVTNIALKVGAVTETVEVNAAEQPVPTDSGVTSTTLNNTMVSEIAIQGRDAAELIRLMPGMAMNSGLGNTQWNSALTQINSGPIGAFSSNGSQPNGGMQLIMDGSVITDSGNQGTQIANINQDMTQEVTIQTSSFDAEHAHGPVTFSATGKSGTSQFHGEGYVYTRNGSLNANNHYFNELPTPVAKPIDHYWYEGFNVGGPALPKTRFKDKAFFFFGFEHLHQMPAGALHKYVIPTAAMMSGDYTAASLAPYKGFYGSGSIPCADPTAWNYGNFCKGAVDNSQVALYDSNGTAYVPAAYDASVATYNTCKKNNGTNCSLPPVSGSRISPSLFDPDGVTLMKLLAGAPGLTSLDPTKNGGFNAQFLDRTPVDSNEMNIRGDFNITSKMRAFATFTRQPETDVNNIGLWWWPGNAVPYPSQIPAKQLARDYSFGVTNTFTPALINEATFGYAYFINPVTLKNPTAANPATYNYNVQTPYAQPVPQVPDIISWCCTSGGGGSNSSSTSAGLDASSFGTTPKWYGSAAGKDSYTPDFSDNLTWIKRSHTFKFGFFWARYANVQTEGACCGGGTVGQWDFDPWTSNSSFNNYSDMLIGHANSFGQASTNFVDNVVYNEYDFYVQDSWKATRRLTLHFGVRFEHEGQWYPTNENKGIMVWNPNNSVQPYSASSTAPLAGFEWHGIDSKVPISGWASHSFYADPRIGVAYDLLGNGRTVLRGGFGIYRHNVAYNSVTANGLLDAPLGLKSFSSNCTFTSLASLSTCSAATAGSRTSQNVEGMMFGDDRAPRTQNWNITIDQRVGWNSILELSYQGSRSRDLFLSPNGGGGISINNINYIPVGVLFKPDPVSPGSFPNCSLGKAGTTDGKDPNPGQNCSYGGDTFYCQGTASTTCITGAPPSNAIPDFRSWGYNALYLARHGGYSNYNGLLVQWIKQTGPAVFNVNYTWSHTLGTRIGDNDNGQGSGAALDAFNLRNNYGTLAFDRRHIFNAAYVINLPTPVHHNLFGEEVVNGWKLSGTMQYQSGPPLQPLTGTGLNPSYAGGVNNQSILGTDGIALEPILTCNPAKGLQSGQYFNPNCFQEPSTRGQNGPLIWPNVTGPSYFGGDLGMYKDFKVRESQKLQFRFTAFNFLNHPNRQFGLSDDINLRFSTPGGGNTNLDTNGKAAYTVGNRTLEIALKYLF